MPAATLADFVAKFTPESHKDGKPTAGRVLLSSQQLVLASEDDRLTIPLADVFDVVIGEVPSDLTGYFDDSMAIAHRGAGEPQTVILEADNEKISRFKTVLFKALLGGATVLIRHPAKVGGRVTDVSATEASLRPQPGAIKFEGLDPSLEIDLTSVIHFEKSVRTIDDQRRPALEVRFIDDGEALTSEVVMGSSRCMNLLGRYLRLEYSGMVEEVRSVDLTDPETELLTAVYSGAGGGDLARLLNKDSSTVTMLLNQLEEKDLVCSTSSGTTLTSLGRLAVSERVEDINR